MSIASGRAQSLPLPGAGTSADPLNLDPVDPYDPEGLLEPPAGLPEGRSPPPHRTNRRFPQEILRTQVTRPKI